MEIEPAIGRVVWLYANKAAYDSDGKTLPIEETDEPYPAIICAVHSSKMEINVVAWTPRGVCLFFEWLSIFDYHYGVVEGHPYCRWMPHQLGQEQKNQEAAAVAVALAVHLVEGHSGGNDPAS